MGKELGNYTSCPAMYAEGNIRWACQLEHGHKGQHMAVISATLDRPPKPERTLWWKENVKHGPNP